MDNIAIFMDAKYTFIVIIFIFIHNDYIINSSLPEVIKFNRVQDDRKNVGTTHK